MVTTWMGETISIVTTTKLRSTQPSIPLIQKNRVPTCLAEVKVGMLSHLHPVKIVTLHSSEMSYLWQL